ncbi:MAG: transporter substrate-binding protein [Candidatus Thiodiazotropha sp. (ex Epidulcina cf. delphinae)]|nr:transporter substrate-binding protein [Candidatus Thiodiazotropha sp. (ex Epidulcina cf. delphinae)]
MAKVKIGILHSLHGTMAVSESALVDAAVMAVEEINQQGGVLGQRVEPVIEDGASDPQAFEQQARKLLVEDRVTTLFGCWTSASRKAVKPVVESAGSLLWYPVQYEGLEESPHIVYTGSCLNQQIEPAVNWTLQQGRRSCLLIGSDYVFPRTANPLIASMVEHSGGTVLADRYLPLGWQDFSPIVEDVRRLRPEVIFNTLNGDSNYAFFRQLHGAGLRADKLPVMSFSIAEGEQQVIAVEGEGHFACWSYFQTLDTEQNRAFIQRYRFRYGSDRRCSDPIVTAYSQVWLWRNAVEAAGSLDPDTVRHGLAGKRYVGPAGEMRIRSNHHVDKPVLIGRARRDGLFDLVWHSEAPIEPKPWLGVEDLSMAAVPLIKESLRQFPQSVHYANILEAEIGRRKQVEELLRESEKRFRALVSAAPMGIYLTDPKGKCTYVNTRWCEMAGMTPGEAHGDGWLEAIHPDDRRYVSENWKRVEKSGGHWTLEYRFRNKQNRTIWIAGVATTLWNEAGNITGFIGCNTDISERKQAEEELAQYREHLEELVKERTLELAEAKETAEAANHAKSIFLANISHELRTPLNAILGFSEMLVRAPDTTSSQQEKISIINRSGAHLLGMINDVLDLSKIEAGRMELEPVAFDLPGMLEDIGRMFEVRAKDAGLRFDLQFDPTLARFLKADAGKLHQILINLLGNAAKFTRKGGFSLHARTLPVDNDLTMVTLRIEVQDSGPGITPEQQERIFEPFVQTQAAYAGPKGTGLGLNITRSFVNLMRGDISVESSPGKGSLFRVDLPVTLAEETEARGVEAVTPEVIGLESVQPEWRILVVEDNAENRLLLSSLLAQAGFEIRGAENGEEAVTLFQEWRPHFIWMDMRMPVMDGYQATSKIRSLPGGDTVKIVAITASAYKEQRKNILDAGCDEVVHKPFLTQEIFDALAKQLGVRYRYEESAVEATTEWVEISTEAVAALPKALLGTLRVTALSLDNVDFDAALAPVRDLDPALAEGLATLAREFRFDRILKLLDDTGKRDA